MTAGLFHRPVADLDLAGLAIVRRPVGGGCPGTRARMTGSAIGCASSPIDRGIVQTFCMMTRGVSRAKGRVLDIIGNGARSALRLSRG